MLGPALEWLSNLRLGTAPRADDVLAWDERKRTAAIWFDAPDFVGFHPDITMPNPDVLLRRAANKWTVLGGSSAQLDNPFPPTIVGNFATPIAIGTTRSIGRIQFKTSHGCASLLVEDRKIELDRRGYAIVIYSQADKPQVEGLAGNGESLGSFDVRDL